jgi:soluble lytic murein transglycosylase-like protein
MRVFKQWLDVNVSGLGWAIGRYFARLFEMKRHRHADPNEHPRRRRRHRHVRAVMAGAMFFAPHAARGTLPTREQTPSTFAQASIARELAPEITITSEFFVPAQHAYEPLIQEAAALHHVDPSLVRAVMRAESGFDAMAVSSAGAQGLMQLLPEVSEELGVTDPFDPRQNIFGGVRYLRWLLDRHNGDETLALASYNAGPGAVDTYAGVPPFPETQQYVRTITDRLARERAFAPDPPVEQR